MNINSRYDLAVSLPVIRRRLLTHRTSVQGGDLRPRSHSSRHQRHRLPSVTSSASTRPCEHPAPSTSPVPGRQQLPGRRLDSRLDGRLGRIKCLCRWLSVGARSPGRSGRACFSWGRVCEGHASRCSSARGGDSLRADLGAPSCGFCPQPVAPEAGRGGHGVSPAARCWRDCLTCAGRSLCLRPCWQLNFRKRFSRLCLLVSSS